MALKNRMGFLIKSQFNHLVTIAEDPEKVINQAVEEIEDGLDSARSVLSALKSMVEEDKRLLHRTGDQIAYWQERAESFIGDDMEENAKEALRMRRVLEEQKRDLEFKYAEDEGKLNQMGHALKELESRAHVVGAKRNILIQKIRLVKGQARGLGVKRDATLEMEFKEPFRVFEKMEQRIEGADSVDYLSRGKRSEVREREENLISEEIARIRRKIKKEADQ